MSPPIVVEQKLIAAGQMPDRMTFVSGGDYRMVAWNRPTDERARLYDYFLDKYEVSNQEYKEFINAGGYLKQGEVETEAHYPSGSLSHYERRKEPPPDVLADLVHGMGIPAYLIPHPDKVIWLLHQHRAAYDLWEHSLGGLLSALGFVKSGVHRSKAVTRYSQGGINVVVNSDKEGFAHAYGIVHGTSVCALGLRVSDAQ